MSHRSLNALVLVSWVGLLVAPTLATCPGPLTLEEQFARSQVVFIGRAVAQQIVVTDSSRGTRATETTFEVEEFWKGESKANVRVQTCGWHDEREAMTCSEAFTFVPGARSVVFAAGNPLETSLCHPTALADRAEATLTFLSAKSSRLILPSPRT